MLNFYTSFKIFTSQRHIRPFGAPVGLWSENVEVDKLFFTRADTQPMEPLLKLLRISRQ